MNLHHEEVRDPERRLDDTLIYLFDKLGYRLHSELREDRRFRPLLRYVFEATGGFLTEKQIISCILNFVQEEEARLMNIRYPSYRDHPDALTSANLEVFVTTLISAHTNFALVCALKRQPYPLAPDYAQKLHDMEIAYKLRVKHP